MTEATAVTAVRHRSERVGPTGRNDPT